jgi:hypothetical protein
MIGVSVEPEGSGSGVSAEPSGRSAGFLSLFFSNPEAPAVEVEAEAG